MADRWLSRALIACTACVLLGTVARAASVDDEAQRLDLLRYYVAGLDRGWDPLLDEYARTLAALRSEGAGDVGAVLAQRDEVAWARAGALFQVGAEGDGRGEEVRQAEERCLELCRLLKADALDGGLRGQAQKRIAALSIRRGERFETDGDEAAALDAYLEAVREDPSYLPGFEKVGALGVRQADRLVDSQEFDQALEKIAEVLGQIEGGLGSAHASVEAARSRQASIRGSTGTVTLRFLGDPATLDAVKGAKTDFRQAEIRLAPQDGGAVPPLVTAAAPRRVRAATYEATVTAPGGDAVVTAAVTVTPEGGSVTVPVVIPEGMVYVGPGNGVGAFLCDRTEVSTATFARVLGRSVPSGREDFPATGVSYDDALRYAAEAGKRVPTLAQWVQAALGEPGGGLRKYPWGSFEGTPGVHFIGGADGPGRVDDCPDGDSAWGVRNTARNAWEWVQGGWFVGGGWSFSTFVMSNLPIAQSSDTWELAVLRQAVPSLPTFQSPSFSDDPKKYQRFIEAVWRANEPQIGLRCIIPLE